MKHRLLLLAAAAVLAVSTMGADSCAGVETSTTRDGDSTGSTSSSNDSSGGAKPSKPKAVTFGKGKASGDFAVASASGTINKPTKVRVLVDSDPAQSAQVSTSTTCGQGAGSAGSGSDQFTAQTPIDRKLDLPSKDVSDCIVSATVQLQTGGSVRVRLRGTEGG